MATSRFELTGRILAGIAAASLLAGVSVDAAADYTDQPRIRLQLGLGSWDPDLSSGGVSRFIFEEPGNPNPVEEQTFTFDRGPLKCTVLGYKDGAGGSRSLSAPPLVTLTPFPTPPMGVGMGPDSMGVYSGSSGVNCYRITANVSPDTDETLTINVNGSGNAATGPMSGYALNRLELDMEVKANAIFKLTVLTAGTPGNTYHLYSGRSVEGVSGLTTGEQSYALGKTKFQCGAGSADSNQDSGPNDNCRWIINDFGTGFTLTAEAGEGSLEGGGDWGGDYGTIADAFANNTIIYLVRLSETGILTCDDTCDESTGVCYDDITGQIGDGQSFARCSVRRLANVGTAGDSGGVCLKPFPYRLSTELVEDACNLDQTGTPDFNRQFAASVKVQFPPEARVDIDEPSIYKTQVQFSCQSGDPGCILKPSSSYGLTPKWAPDRCEGTVVLDANGNKTILEVLGADDYYTKPSGGAVDGDGFVDDDNNPTTPKVNIVDDKTPSAPLDWACILETTIEYVGSNQMQRTDTVLFWGDARFSTQ